MPFFLIAAFNDCYSQQQVTEQGQCAAIADPDYLTYDPYLAAELASWSSLAYMRPNTKDKKSTKDVVNSVFGGKYEVGISNCFI